MRTISSALSAVLYGSNLGLVSDLVTLSDAAGTALARVTTWDQVIVFGGNSFLPGAILSRGRRRTTLSTSLEVDTQSVEFAPQGLTIGGLSWQKAALAGQLEGATVSIRRAYMATPGVIPGTGSEQDVALVFVGDVIQAEPSSTKLRLECKSIIARLAATVLPPRQFVAYCPYAVYGERCGVATTGKVDSRTVAAGSTASSIVLSSASTNAVVGSWIVIGSDRRGVATVNGATITLSSPLPAAPAVGSTVTVTRGCDGTFATCRDVFANGARFGGFKDAPLAEGNG